MTYFKRYYLFLLFFCGLANNFSQAQESNYWNFSGNKQFLLNFNNEPPTLEFNTYSPDLTINDVYFYPRMAYSSLKGELQFFSAFDSLFNLKTSVKYIKYASLDHVKGGVFCKTSNNSEIAIFHWQNDSTYDEKHRSSYWSRSLYLTVYDIVSGTIKSKNDLGEAFRQFYTIKPITDGVNILSCKYYPNLGCYWIIGGKTDSLFGIKFDPNLGVVDEFFKSFPATYSFMSKIVINHEGDKFAIANLESFKEIVNHGISWGYNNFNSRISLFDFDPLNGKILFNKFLWNDTIVLPIGLGGNIYYATEIGGIAFSPNDSILYIGAKDKNTFPYQHIWQFILNPTNGEKSIYKLKFPYDNFPLIDEKGYFYVTDFKLGPNGKLYIATSQRSLYHISYINYPNIKGAACNIIYDAIRDDSNPNKTSRLQLLQWGYTIDNYKKVLFKASNTCTNRHVNFENLTDSQYFVSYKFFFGDGDSCEMDNNNQLMQKGNNNSALSDAWGVGHIYTKPGKYFVKLKAINQQGGHIWYSDSIEINQAPKANFTVADTTGCQWIAYKTIDKSVFPPKLFGPQPTSYTYNWQFGDGKDTTLLFATVPVATAASVGHTYTQNGLYKVSLTVNDGYCADTFSLQNKVNILPAPQPGILLNPNSAMGCSPLEIAAHRRYTDPIDSVIWQLGEGSQQTAYTNPASIQHTYYHTLSNTQNYLLQQTLYGPTGCVTKDSLWLAVQPGFEKGYVPTLIRASVENENTALVQWTGHLHAKGYTLFKDNAIAAQTNDTFFIAPYTQVQNSAYWISANNACDQSTAISNLGQLMVLTGENTNNKTALLQWTAYQDWSKDMGVLHYTIEAKNNSTGAFEALSNNDTTHYTDNNFIQSGYYNRCYRITATQANNTNIVSHSNTLCLGYASVIFVPNAFSPNNDGLNDVFEPFNIGFKSYTLSVYDRWGEKIAEGRNWDGTTQGQTVPNGIYFYRITGKTGKDENVFLNGQVTVVR